jgi:single-strand DNA-binding protein
MPSHNHVELIGHLGHKPELRQTKNGTPVASFSIATNVSWYDNDRRVQERTDWHRVVAWGRLAGTISGHLDTGAQVHIMGSLRTRQWTDDAGVKRWTTEIHASRVLFLGRRSHYLEASPDTVEPPPPEQAPAVADDEIPF